MPYCKRLLYLMHKRSVFHVEKLKTAKNLVLPGVLQKNCYTPNEMQTSWDINIM